MKQLHRFPWTIRRVTRKEGIMIVLTIITAAYHFGGRCAMIGEREK